MNRVMSWLLQASTIRGIVQIGGSMGLWTVSEAMTVQIIAVVMGLVGLIDVIYNERKARQKAADDAVRHAIAPQDRPWLTERERAAYDAGKRASREEVR